MTGAHACLVLAVSLWTLAGAGCGAGSSEANNNSNMNGSGCDNDCGPCGQSGSPAWVTQISDPWAYWAVERTPAVRFRAIVKGTCPPYGSEWALAWNAGTVTLLETPPAPDASPLTEDLGPGVYGFADLGLTVAVELIGVRLQATFDASGTHVEADCGVLDNGAVACDGI
jgi:hypothetical protein